MVRCPPRRAQRRVQHLQANEDVQEDVLNVRGYGSRNAEPSRGGIQTISYVFTQKLYEKVTLTVSGPVFRK